MVPRPRFFPAPVLTALLVLALCACLSRPASAIGIRLTLECAYTKISELGQPDVLNPNLPVFRYVLTLRDKNLTTSSATFFRFEANGSAFNPALSFPGVPAALAGVTPSLGNTLTVSVTPGDIVNLSFTDKSKHYRYVPYPSCEHDACITSWDYTHQVLFSLGEIFDVPEAAPKTFMMYLYNFLRTRMGEHATYSGYESAQYTYTDSPPGEELVIETRAYKSYSFTMRITNVQLLDFTLPAVTKTQLP